MFNEEGKMLAVNYQASQLTGYTRNALVDMNIQELTAPGAPGLGNAQPARLQTTLKHRKGVEIAIDVVSFPLKDGERFSILSILRPSRTTPAAQLPESDRDPLTGLPNREGFVAGLRRALTIAAQRGQRVAVLVFRIVDFPAFIEQVGLERSEALLVLVSERLKRNTRDVDVVAHIGGDSFAVFLENVPSQQVAEYVAKKILNQLLPAYLLKADAYSLDIQVGLALYPNDGDSIEGLIHSADERVLPIKP